MKTITQTSLYIHSTDIFVNFIQIQEETKTTCTYKPILPVHLKGLGGSMS